MTHSFPYYALWLIVSESSNESHLLLNLLWCCNFFTTVTFQKCVILNTKCCSNPLCFDSVLTSWFIWVLTRSCLILVLHNVDSLTICFKKAVCSELFKSHFVFYATATVLMRMFCVLKFSTIIQIDFLGWKWSPITSSKTLFVFKNVPGL